MNYLTYSYLLTPLHTGASSQAGNMMGIARETHTELPYLPSSSLRGKIRSVLEASHPDDAGGLFGERLKDGQQPTEGEVWFADATLLLFPIASYSHQYVWITCPLWLSRWNRWLRDDKLDGLIQTWRDTLSKTSEDGGKSAITSVTGQQIYLQGARITAEEIESIDPQAECWKAFAKIPDGQGILDLQHKLIIVSDSDCGALVETGLQREVRIALNESRSFRSEEAIPSETVMFFPWGLKQSKSEGRTDLVRIALKKTLKGKLQFGGLEGLGRGWADNTTVEISHHQGA
jgi:CRISPR-associated protein Cmr4